MAAGQRRRIILPAVSLLAVIWSVGVRSNHALFSPMPGHGPPSTTASRWVCGQAHRGGRMAMSARGGASAEAETDSVEVGGFAGFVVGLALLPHVVYALTVAFKVAAQGESFDFGPFGLELISCVTAVGVALWSLGSFVQRGRGLPAGPLGLLGLSEGLAYLGTLGLVVALIVTSLRGGGAKLPNLDFPALPTISAPSGFKAPDIKVPTFNAPSVQAPDFKLPAFKAPEIKVPEFKVPEFKAPDIKVPEFKAPEIKAPEFKAPDMKVPEFKAPEFKMPDLPKPSPKPEVEKKVEKVVEPAKPAPPPPAPTKSPQYDDLFD